MYFRNITLGDLQRERDEVLSTNVPKIRELAQMIGDILRQNYLCVVGNEAVIEENSNYFEKVYNIFDNN
jgi:Zn-dependent M16 (insulinase) family peptidase